MSRGASLKQPTVSIPEKRCRKAIPRKGAIIRIELGSTGRNKIPLPLQAKNCFLHCNRTVSRRNICLVVKLSVVRLVLLQNVVDGGQQHPGNGNNRSTALTYRRTKSFRFIFIITHTATKLFKLSRMCSSFILQHFMRQGSYILLQFIFWEPFCNKKRFNKYRILFIRRTFSF